jgi:hypothetical protein
MARYVYQGIFRDKFGHIVSGGTVSVFLTGTSTPASIYAASTGGVAVNSVLSDSSGRFELYVDDSDYSASQAFRIVLSKVGFSPSTWDNLNIYGSSTPIWDYGTAAPTTGYHAPPFIRWNSSVVPGENIGWVCGTAGTPGTFYPFGIISLDPA